MKNKICTVCGSKKLIQTKIFYYCNHCETNFIEIKEELVLFEPQRKLLKFKPGEGIEAMTKGLQELYDPQSMIYQTFSKALIWLKQGKMVTRAIWKDTCIFLTKGRTVEYNTFQNFKNNACQAFDPPQDIEITDHIDAKHNGKYITGVVLQQYDLLAEDWEIYKNKEV